MIRVVGNVLDNHHLGSIEYAAEHLGTKLIVMLGHTGCGAIKAVIDGHSGGFIDYILQDIALAIGEEKDEFKATCLNVQHGVERIRSASDEMITATNRRRSARTATITS